MYLALARGGDFEAFTDEAIKILGDRQAAIKTGKKVWIGRRTNRLHMVVTESSEETPPCKFAFILTNNNNGALKG